MYKNNVKKKAKKSVKSHDNTLTLWDEAITDAKKMQQEAKMQIVRLKQAVRAFERLRDSGVPFPSESGKQSEAES